MEIRDNALNVYHKGHSLLGLSKRKRRYEVSVHEKFQLEPIGDNNWHVGLIVGKPPERMKR